MKKAVIVLLFIVLCAGNSRAAVRDIAYDGSEVYLHVAKDHMTTVIFPESIIQVVRGFGADSYVIQRNNKEPNTLELMPTSLEATAEMTISGVSGESYVIRCIDSKNYDTKVTLRTIPQAVLTENLASKKSENTQSDLGKVITPAKDVLTQVTIDKQVPAPSPASHNDPVATIKPILVESRENLDLPAPLNLKITLKGNDLPLKIYFSTISQVTGYNIITTPEIESQHTSINLENIEVWRALKSLLFKFGWGFKVSKEDLIITSSETRMFSIKIPAADQTFTDETSNESYTDNGANSGNNSSSAQQNQDIKVGTKIVYDNTATKISLWTDLENSIKSILTPQTGTYSISKSSGTITVTDKPGVLDKIAELIDETNDIIDRQQTFEIQIYEVTLSDSNETGVDWQAVETSLKGQNVLNLATNFSSVGFTGGQLLSLSGGSNSSGNNGVTAFLKALASQGDVHTISKPRITVTNLFPAVIQSVTSIPYISGTGQTISNVSTVNDVTTSEVSAGLTMRLDAKISDDNKTVLNISVAENTLDSMTAVPAGGGLTIQEPQVSTKSLTTNVEIDPDKTLVLGGLISTTKNNSTQGIPYLSRIPFLGNAFSYKDNSVTKSELVIIITPEEVTRNIV